MKQEQNLTMLCDFYEFTMANGYFETGYYKKKVYFDVFFRTVPDGGGFAIAPVWNRSLTIFKTCIFLRKTCLICVEKAASVKDFCNT